MKKVTKYLLCLTLVCTFCFTLVGCSKEDTSDTNQSNQIKLMIQTMTLLIMT